MRQNMNTFSFFVLHWKIVGKEKKKTLSLLLRRRRRQRSARRRRRPRRCRRHDGHGRRQHPQVLDRPFDRREPRELVVVPFSSAVSSFSGSSPSSCSCSSPSSCSCSCSSPPAEKGPGRQRPRRGRERLAGLHGEVELGLHRRSSPGEDHGRCFFFLVDMSRARVCAGVCFGWRG